MIKIGLDLSVRTCGIAVWNDETKIILYSSYKSVEKDYLKLQMEMVEWVFCSLVNTFGISLNTLKPKLVLEDVFVGQDPIGTIDVSRTQGAVIDRYYKATGKFPQIISAITARKHVGLNTWAEKAEIQLFVIDKFKLGKVSTVTRGGIVQTGNFWELEYKRLSEAKKKASKVAMKKLSLQFTELNRTAKNALKRLSTEITKETGVTEHSADAILLTMYEDLG